MKVNLVSNNIMHFEFEKQKDLSLMFFRIQEYYESQHERIKGHSFSVWDFINEHMDDKGNIEYFSFWEGFNYPGYVLKDWMKLQEQDGHPYTQSERIMINEIRSFIDMTRPFYVIGTLAGDKPTYKHEIAHALFYLDSEYRIDMLDIISEMPFSLERKVEKALDEMGYASDVLIDEMQAWLSTSKYKELIKEFQLDTKEEYQYIKKIRKVLRKYNKKIKPEENFLTQCV